MSSSFLSFSLYLSLSLLLTATLFFPLSNCLTLPQTSYLCWIFWFVPSFFCLCVFVCVCVLLTSPGRQSLVCHHGWDSRSFLRHGPLICHLQVHVELGSRVSQNIPNVLVQIWGGRGENLHGAHSDRKEVSKQGQNSVKIGATQWHNSGKTFAKQWQNSRGFVLDFCSCISFLINEAEWDRLCCMIGFHLLHYHHDQRHCQVKPVHKVGCDRTTHRPQILPAVLVHDTKIYTSQRGPYRL